MIHPLRGLIETINAAVGMASDQRHEYVTLEHLTIAVLGDADVKLCLDGLRIDSNAILDTLYAFFADGHVAQSGYPPLPSDDFNEVVYRATGKGMYYAQRPTEAIHVLVMLLEHRPKGSCAVTTLLDAGLEASLVQSYIDREPELVGEDKPAEPRPTPRFRNTNKKTTEAEQAILKYCVNLNARASKSEIDPLIGRHGEVDDVCQTMVRRTKNNVVLVGEPGVGKTAIAEGFALLHQPWRSRGSAEDLDRLRARPGRAGCRNQVSR